MKRSSGNGKKDSQVVLPSLESCPSKGMVVSARPWKLINGTIRPGLQPAEVEGSAVG